MSGLKAFRRTHNRKWSKGARSGEKEFDDKFGDSAGLYWEWAEEGGRWMRPEKYGSEISATNKSPDICPMDIHDEELDAKPVADANAKEWIAAVEKV